MSRRFSCVTLNFLSVIKTDCYLSESCSFAGCTRKSSRLLWRTLPFKYTQSLELAVCFLFVKLCTRRKHSVCNSSLDSVVHVTRSDDATFRRKSDIVRPYRVSQTPPTSPFNLIDRCTAWHLKNFWSQYQEALNALIPFSSATIDAYARIIVKDTLIRCFRTHVTNLKNPVIIE